MANKEFIYVTKSGRESKQRFINYNLYSVKNNKSKKMPILPREEDDNMRQQREELDKQRTELEQLRAQLEAERLAIEEAREQYRAEQRRAAAERAAAAATYPDLPAPLQQAPQVQENLPPRAASLPHPTALSENQRNFEIGMIVNNLQNMNIDVKTPKFFDEMSLNPCEFLEDMERFYILKGIKEDRKLVFIQQALDGKARLWLDLKGSFENYTAFKEAFLSEFYSTPVAIKIKSKWIARKFNGQNGTLQTFFYKQAKEANYFIPKMSAYEINYSILQQFPFWVQESLASIDFSNSSLIGQTLALLDTIYAEKQSVNIRKQYQNNATINRVHVNNNRGRRVRRGAYANGYSQFQSNSNYTNQSGQQQYNNQSRTNFQMPNIHIPPPNLPQSNIYGHGQNTEIVPNNNINLNENSTR